MSTTIEYCVIPHDRWTVVRFSREDNGELQGGGTVQRGEFQNEDAANEVAVLLARAEGAKIRRSARKSLQNLAASSGVEVIPLGPTMV